MIEYLLNYSYFALQVLTIVLLIFLPIVLVMRGKSGHKNETTKISIEHINANFEDSKFAFKTVLSDKKELKSYVHAYKKSVFIILIVSFIYKKLLDLDYSSKLFSKILQKEYSLEGLAFKGSLEEYMFPGRCINPYETRTRVPDPTGSTGTRWQTLGSNEELPHIGDPKKCFELDKLTKWVHDDGNLVVAAHERFGHVHPSILKYYDEYSGAESDDLNREEQRGIEPSSSSSTNAPDWETLTDTQKLEWRNDKDAYISATNIWKTMNEDKRNNTWDGTPGVDIFHENYKLISVD